MPDRAAPGPALGPADELRLAFRLARRELRSGSRGFVVFLLCLALGVAAIAAVGSISAAVSAGVSRDAAALLGGDLQIESTNQPVSAAELGEAVPEAQRSSAIVRTTAMARVGERNVVTTLKAVDDAYPLFGRVRLDPPMPLDQALADGGIVVEDGLLRRLGIGLGDPIMIGEGQFEVRARLGLEPDRMSGFISIGPRSMIALGELERTQAILPGSLARYAYRFDLPAGVDPTAREEEIEAAWSEVNWGVRSRGDVQPAFTRFTGRLASYLTVAGLTALLIGGVGIALAVQNYLSARSATIATLKCLGAPSRLIFQIYLVQVLALTTLGVVIGLVIGVGAPASIRLVPEDLLPVPVLIGFYPLPLLIAAGCGYLAALAFTIWPLARARDVSAAGMFRSLVAAGGWRPKPQDVVLLGLTFVGFTGLSMLAVTDAVLALAFIAVAAVSAVVLAGITHLLLLGAARAGRAAHGPLRLALANLRRPGAGSRGVVAALGAGLAVLTMVALLQHNLDTELEQRLPDRAPAFFFIDIQPHQLATFEQIVGGFAGATIMNEAPMVRGRVVRIGGRPVDEVEIARGVRWTARRDRGLTFGIEAPEDGTLVAGAWWPQDYAGPPQVSVDAEVAAGYGVGIGDTLSFSVLGRIIETEIASLREVEWEDAGMNWVFVLSPGVLEAAPHTWIATVENPAATDAALIDAVAAGMPNVTPISVRAIVSQLGAALAKIGLAIGAVAVITLLSGMMVLAGAIAAARRRHLYESVVLKVLGARRFDLLRLFLFEYLSLGLVAGIAGGLLGTIGAAIIVTLVMDLTWSFAPLDVLGVVGAALVLILVVGFIGTWRLLGRPAAPVLRSA